MNRFTQSCVHGPHSLNISSIFSSNSEEEASELLENIEEMLPRYYMKSHVIIEFKSSITHCCVTPQERVKHTTIYTN